MTATEAPQDNEKNEAPATDPHKYCLMQLNRVNISGGHVLVNWSRKAVCETVQ